MYFVNQFFIQTNANFCMVKQYITPIHPYWPVIKNIRPEEGVGDRIKTRQYRKQEARGLKCHLCPGHPLWMTPYLLCNVLSDHTYGMNFLASIKDDMDEKNATLIGAHGYCTQVWIVHSFFDTPLLCKPHLIYLYHAQKYYLIASEKYRFEPNFKQA